MMHPQRVVSLWDMITAIGGTITAIANVVLAMKQIEEGLQKPDTISLVFKPSLITGIRSSINELGVAARALNLDATLSSVLYCDELISRCRNENGQFILDRNHGERLEAALDGLRRNFLAQMESRLVFVVYTEDAKFITDNSPPFGLKVEDAFPLAAEEISEAAKCLALQRSTAVVFHLMRAMEVAVKVIGEKLGIVNVEKEWGKILSEMKSKIELMDKGQDRDNWSEIHTHLYHVKQAWRNNTMHPKKTYTEEQANQVFFAVNSFMVNLAVLVSA